VTSPRARNLGLGLALLGVMAHFAITLPARQATIAAGDEYARLRADRREALRRLAQIEKRAALLARMGGGLPAETDKDGAVQEVRADVVGALREAGISRVRLEVRPAASGPALARVGLHAEGGFFDLVRLLSLLARPGSGLILERLSLSNQGTEVGLGFEAAAFREAF
jgi:hypothetical protein